MKKRYSLDPDNPERAEKVESALLEGLTSLQPSAQQRSKIRAQLFQRIHASVAAESPRITIHSEQGSWHKIRPDVRVPNPWIKIAVLSYPAMAISVHQKTIIEIHSCGSALISAVQK